MKNTSKRKDQVVQQIYENPSSQQWLLNPFSQATDLALMYLNQFLN